MLAKLEIIHQCHILFPLPQHDIMCPITPTIILFLSLCTLSIFSLASAVPDHNDLKENDVIVQINSTAGPITQLFTLRIIETDPVERRSAISADNDNNEDNDYNGEEESWQETSFTNTDMEYDLAGDEDQDEGLEFGRALGIGMGLDYVSYAYRPFLQLRRLYDARIIYAGPSDVLCAILHYNEAVKAGKMRMYGSYFSTEEPLEIGSDPLNFVGGIFCVAPIE